MENKMEKMIRFYQNDVYLSIEEDGEDYIMEMTEKNDEQMSAGFVISKDELCKISNAINDLISKE
jgi:hypothetical protein